MDRQQVGTVKSLWEANMDLLEDTPALNLFDHTWRIYSVNPNEPPQYIAPYAQVKESLVNEGCIVEGHVEHSVLFQGVHIAQGATVKDCVVMPNAVIGKNVYIEKAIVPPNIEIPDGTSIYASSSEEEVILVTEGLLGYFSERG